MLMRYCLKSPANGMQKGSYENVLGHLNCPHEKELYDTCFGHKSCPYVYMFCFMNLKKWNYEKDL